MGIAAPMLTYAVLSVLVLDELWSNCL